VRKSTLMILMVLTAVTALAAGAMVSAADEVPRQGVPTGCDPSVMSAAYWQIWNAAEQAKIDADIERNRKADYDVKVGGEGEGGAVPDGTVVTVEQIAHDFRFGAHIFNFNQLGKTEYNDAYKASYGQGGLFNQATVSFYWIDHEPVPGKFRFDGDYDDTERYWNGLTRDEAMRERYWRRPASAPVIDYLKARDVAVHGHILVWGNAKPYWIYDWYCPEAEKRVFDEIGIPRHSAKYGWEPCGQGWHRGYMGVAAKAWRERYKNLDERDLERRAPEYARNLKRIFKKRLDDVAARFGDVVDSWDVVNESSHDWARYRTSRTGLGYCFSHYGLMPGDYQLDAFLEAKRVISPKARLCINDYNIAPAFFDQIEDLTRHGAKIDVVGCQMHIFNTNDCMRLAMGATNVNWVGTPGTIERRLDMMAKAGRPLHVSEVTIAATDTTGRGRQIQAILTRNIYRKWFSHAKTMGITWWNTVDGAGVAGEPLVSGLFTRDMRHKPAYDALDELINREWRTNEKVKVSGEGEEKTVRFRGFKGRYRLSWRDAAGKPHVKVVDR